MKNIQIFEHTGQALPSETVGAEVELDKVWHSKLHAHMTCTLSGVMLMAKKPTILDPHYPPHSSETTLG